MVELYYQRIYAYCYHFLGKRSEAEDATQEIFLKAMRCTDDIGDAAAFRFWIYRVARNHCIDRTRWWKRFLARAAEEGEIADTRANQADLSELREELRQFLLALPIRQRDVFILRHWHGFSTEETAKLLGISSGTVKSHLKRAVDAARATLFAAAQSTATRGGSSSTMSSAAAVERHQT